MSMIFITQELNDLLGNQAGEAVLNNASTKVLLAQDDAVIDKLASILHLNEKEKAILVNAQKGRGILMFESERIPFVVKASPKEHALITTNPEDAKASKSEKVEYEEFKFDINDGLFRKKDLNETLIEECLKNGYIEERFAPFGVGRGEVRLIKPRINESVEHAFFVYIVRNEIRKYTDRITVNERKAPKLVEEGLLQRLKLDRRLTMQRIRLRNEWER